MGKILEDINRGIAWVRGLEKFIKWTARFWSSNYKSPRPICGLKCCQSVLRCSYIATNSEPLLLAKRVETLPCVLFLFIENVWKWSFNQSLKRLRWLNFTGPIQSSFLVAIPLIWKWFRYWTYYNSCGFCFWTIAQKTTRIRHTYLLISCKPLTLFESFFSLRMDEIMHPHVQLQDHM